MSIDRKFERKKTLMIDYFSNVYFKVRKKIKNLRWLNIEAKKPRNDETMDIREYIDCSLVRLVIS
jgi:hypothetical protein